MNSEQTSVPVLELQDISVVYSVRESIFSPKLPLRAVNGVSLSIYKRDVVGLVGESGCGKTTLSRVLLGLEKPSSGTTFIDGKPIEEWDRRAIAHRIQPIFQDPYSSLNPRKSVGDIISLPLRVHHMGKAQEQRAKVDEMLDLVGLPKRLAGAFPNQLSGGQRQRVAIARALVMRPSIVICDEPTSALDVSVQSQILNLLIDLRNELDLTYLFISHNLAVVEHLATQVAVMHLGRIVEQHPTDALFHEPQHPYTKALLTSVLTPNPDLGIPDAHLKQEFPNPLYPPTGCSFHPRCEEAGPRCAKQTPKRLQHKNGVVECHLHDGGVQG